MSLLFEREWGTSGILLGGRTPRLEDLPQLNCNRMLIEGALRLYPPAAIFVRDAIHDDEIGGFHIPKGSMMIVSPYMTQRYPVSWENPQVFDPDRFAPERSEKRHNYAYFPFGGGPRTCNGEIHSE